MKNDFLRWLGRIWPALLIALLLGGYWLLPIRGRVAVLPGGEADLPWPQMQWVAAERRAIVADSEPWGDVLLTVAGRSAGSASWQAQPGGIWRWEWRIPLTVSVAGPLIFYHDCATGCQERGRLALGDRDRKEADEGVPTSLGVVFADPARDWHGRSGWIVDLTYVRPSEDPYWRADALAERVYAATDKGQRVLVRVDYDRGQTLPPAGDELALAEYLAYLRRLARDDRLAGVYGYIIGSGFNALDANSQAPDRPVTPGWYARLFNGYGEDVTHSDNAVQTIRAVNPRVRVLVGPVRPWIGDQGGDQPGASQAPWLDYMRSLVAHLDAAAQAKAAAGIALVAPDGFALQAPGRPDASELSDETRGQEPGHDLPRVAWGGAQAGFRVYRDWLAIINAYPTTRGLPAYITSTNTYAPDAKTPPAQNYPSGWLTAALAEINSQPQVVALCWFMDGPLGDTQWDWFSLARRQGRMLYAAEEFDALLRGGK